MKLLLQKYLKTLPLIAAVLLSACGKPAETAYQKQVGLPGAKWDYSFQPEFSFDIPDTTAKYKVYLILRHDAAFPNSNIWIRLKTKQPGDKKFDAGTRVEATLAVSDGQWLGTNIGSIYEYKILLKPGKDYKKFTQTGTYTVKLEQIMRENPLPSMVNIGLRVERQDLK